MESTIALNGGRTVQRSVGMAAPSSGEPGCWLPAKKSNLITAETFLLRKEKRNDRPAKWAGDWVRSAKGPKRSLNQHQSKTWLGIQCADSRGRSRHDQRKSTPSLDRQSALPVQTSPPMSNPSMPTSRRKEKQSPTRRPRYYSRKPLPPPTYQGQIPPSLTPPPPPLHYPHPRPHPFAHHHHDAREGGCFK
ncbi:hypothetical protein VUR80DRAFT_8175 [Thermomyces stellatus]